MNKPVCVRTEVRERNSAERRVLQVELDLRDAGGLQPSRDARIHESTNKTTDTKEESNKSKP